MHKRNLPHIYPEGADFFVTFRLKNSIPLLVLEKMQEVKELKIAQIEQSKLTEDEKKMAIYAEEKRFFLQYDNTLHKYATDDDCLRNDAIAQIVADKMHEYDKKYYDLLAYCIMPNHVHLLFSLNGYETSKVNQIMKWIKGGSAFLCNKVLNKTGTFWQQESYDHYVRNVKELQNIESYIIENPVKAGLLDDWQQWKFTYWKNL
jgi:putative transposase